MSKPFRELKFDSLEACLADLDRLARGGYHAHGKWDLAQICNHCAYFAELPVKGFDFKVPWLIRVTLGRYLKWKFVYKGMTPGGQTLKPSLYEPGGDEAAAVARLRKAMQDLWTAPEPFHVSPFFGPMTREEWQKLHLNHCSLHFGFLEPKE
jgi:hypothetical protein